MNDYSEVQATNLESGGSPLTAHSTMAQVERVYVNSHQDWLALRALGLPDAAHVRTVSPWLARSAELAAEAADKAISQDQVIELFTAFNDISLRLFDAFRAQDKGAALVAGHAVWDAQRIAYHGALLEAADFIEPICVTRLKGVSPKLRGILQFNWDLLLAGNPNAIVQDVTVDEETLPFVAPPIANFRTRFTAARPADFLFRAMLVLGQKLRSSFGFKTIYVRSESELLKDSSFALLRKGYLLRSLETPALSGDLNESSQDELALMADIEEWIEKDLPERLSQQLVEPAVYPVAETIAVQVRQEVSSYFDWRRRWTATFEALRPAPVAVVSNVFMGAANVALGVSASKSNVPLITCQHGATREITDKHDNNPLFYESMLTDLHLCFNDSHAKISRESSLTRGQCVTVGAPAFYRARDAVKNKTHKALYVSSGLYMGAQDKLHRAASDHATCEFESQLVERCLGPSGQDVLYKPYPALRYLDPDPAVEAARRADNIDVMDDPMDLRYIVDCCSLLITSRSGSTVGFCLCQDVPLIYLEVPGRSLREDVEEGMRAGLFFFDGQATDFHASLTAFLKLPLNRIAEMWEQKSEARSQFIQNYVADSVGVGSARVAQAVDELIRQRSG